MRTRAARVRDAEAVVKIVSPHETIDEDKAINLIEEGNVYVAVDFSANVWGCALSENQIYVKENAPDANVESELRKCY